MPNLEEEVAIVGNLRLLVKFLHEAAGSLHGGLLLLCLYLLSIELLLLLVYIQHLEEEGSAVTLDGGCMELACLGGSNSTSQRGL